jgi:dihydroorotate dehydrogenase electron transfer subunit
MRGTVEYTILENKRVQGDYFKLTIELPGGAPVPVPGQFYNIRCGEGTDPLLRRPLSVHRIVEGKGSVHFEMLYRVIGKGTWWISSRKKGQRLDTLGPLGNGFIVDPNGKDVVLVAGGIGIAPLYALGDHVRRANPEATISVVLGVRNRAENFYEEECRGLGEVFVATDDGSHGFKGTAVDLLAHLLDKSRVSGSDSFFGCGPKAMLRELARISETHALSVQVTLEENMGCGFGACLSCALPLRPHHIRKDPQWPKSFLQQDEDDTKVYSLVCKDGPVYDIKEVDWDEWLA